MPKPKLRFLYSGIRVRDLDRSLRFYQSIGFRVKDRGHMEHGGEWVHLLFPGQVHRLELNHYPRGNRFYEPMRHGTEFDHFGFYVDDADAWVAQLKRRKIPLAAEFCERTMRLVYIADPDGNWVEYFGPSRLAVRQSGRKA